MCSFERNNPPINFCGLSLDIIDHVIQIGRWLSEDIRLIIFRRKEDQETRKLLIAHEKRKQKNVL